MASIVQENVVLTEACGLRVSTPVGFDCSNDINFLPEEVSFLILTFLDLHDWMSVIQVFPRFQRAAKRKPLWKNVDVIVDGRTFSSLTSQKRVFELAPILKSLTLTNFTLDKLAAVTSIILLGSTKQIAKLTLEEVLIAEDDLVNILTHFGLGLKQLTVVSVSIMQTNDVAEWRKRQTKEFRIPTDIGMVDTLKSFFRFDMFLDLLQKNAPLSEAMGTHLNALIVEKNADFCGLICSPVEEGASKVNSQVNHLQSLKPLQGLIPILHDHARRWTLCASSLNCYSADEFSEGSENFDAIGLIKSLAVVVSQNSSGQIQLSKFSNLKELTFVHNCTGTPDHVGCLSGKQILELVKSVPNCVARQIKRLYVITCDFGLHNSHYHYEISNRYPRAACKFDYHSNVCE